MAATRAARTATRAAAWIFEVMSACLLEGNLGADEDRVLRAAVAAGGAPRERGVLVAHDVLEVPAQVPVQADGPRPGLARRLRRVGQPTRRCGTVDAELVHPRRQLERAPRALGRVERAPRPDAGRRRRLSGQHDGGAHLPRLVGDLSSLGSLADVLSRADPLAEDSDGPQVERALGRDPGAGAVGSGGGQIIEEHHLAAAAERRQRPLLLAAGGREAEAETL